MKKGCETGWVWSWLAGSCFFSILLIVKVGPQSIPQQNTKWILHLLLTNSSYLHSEGKGGSTSCCFHASRSALGVQSTRNLGSTEKWSIGQRCSRCWWCRRLGKERDPGSFEVDTLEEDAKKEREKKAPALITGKTTGSWVTFRSGAHGLTLCFGMYDLQNKVIIQRLFTVIPRVCLACRRWLEETSIAGVFQRRVSLCVSMKAKASHHT